VWIFIVFGAGLSFRLWTLSVSMKHERLLKLCGGVEYGERNSSFLAATHVLFYVAAIVEASVRRPAPDVWTKAGAGIYVAGMIILFIVMHALGPLWTVKLIVAKDHVLSEHWIFQAMRHPNYFLAILPELIGLALCLHAFVTYGGRSSLSHPFEETHPARRRRNGKALL